MFANCFKFILITLSLATMTSCNDDIFVERDSTWGDTGSVVTVDSDGGSATMKLNFNGLQTIKLPTATSVVYFNISGEAVTENCPAKDISQIIFTTKHSDGDIIIKGKELTLTSFMNQKTIPEVFPIELDYGSYCRTINIEIKPGTQLEFIGCNYSKSLEVTPHAFDKSLQLLATENNTSKPMTITVRPLLNANVKGMVSTSVPWAQYRRVEMPLPVLNEGQWNVDPTKTSKIIIDSQYEHSHPLWTSSIDYTVPPMSSVNITAKVNYASVRATGLLKFRNPVTGRLYNAPFECKSYQATDYEIVSTPQ